MPSWLSVSTSAITTLNRWIFQATVWLMAIVVPVMLYEVIARYVFNAPTVWGMELAVLLFGPYFLLYFSAPAAYSAFTYRETSFSAWNPPIWPVKAAVPLALALMLLQAVVEFFRALFGEATVDASPAEAHP